MKKIRFQVVFDIVALGLGLSLGFLITMSVVFSSAKKPALYLYPEKDMSVSVILKPAGPLLTTIPEYKNGWNVIAETNGLINGKYSYLFYEASIPITSIPKKGWVVKKSNLSSWFSQILTKIGFNKNEIKDFKEYWLNELVAHDYYEIYLFPQYFVETQLKVKISPRPHTFIRALFYFRKGNSNTKLVPPIINTTKRVGFVATEWGGVTE